MSKKKKSKKSSKKNVSLLQEVDSMLDDTYDDITEEIDLLQTKLYMADKAATKKIKKRKYKKGDEYKYKYDIEMIKKKAREEVIAEMEGTNLLDRVKKLLNDLVPMVVLIARLIASLILSILSLDFVKVNVKPETLEKLNSVYKKAMSISA